MYADVDAATRQRLGVVGFAAQYRRARGTATATQLRFGSAHGAGGGVVEIPVKVQTRIFGTLAARLRLPVQGTGTAARVRWSHALLFPGLQPGETLRRTTSLPRRGALLTRQGAVLASGTPDSSGQRGSALGAPARAITGTLGAIPRDASAAYYAAGYPPDAHIGLSGLERVFQARLAGSPGGELRAGERLIASAPARPGTAVRTSISTALQREAVAALANQQGAIAVLRPSTGEILALAGIPLSGLQPPGSTFKMVTVTGVLEAHLATVRTQFPVRTEAILSGVPLQNANGESCGGSLAEAFAQSCNSVFAPLGARLGARRLVAVAERFGFNEPTGIPGAATSSIPPPSAIPDDLAAGSTAIGQGEVQATALQMAIVAATIGRRGRRPRPSLEAGVVRPAVQAVNPHVAATVERLMLGVVQSGTGQSAAIPGVQVAGKTGTAELRQTVCPGGQQASTTCAGSNPRNTDAWFAAFAPAAHPRLAVCAMLVGAGAGGAAAAPIARQVLLAGLHR
jgi:cell division protein FtsI/penicillin-binding protein 2